MSPVRPAADGGSPGAGMAAASMVVNSRGTDRQGNLYFQAIAFPREGETVDSLPLLRWDRASSRYDTAAWLPLNPEAAPRMVRRSAGRMTVRIGGGQAWPRQTEWAVSAEGRIALVSPDPYRVTWVAGPRRTTGPAVAYTPIRVTEAEKQAYRETLNRGTPVVVRFGGPGGGGTPTPSAAAPTFEEPAWPETLPPFTGRDAPQVSPDGELWVERTRRASDETPVYDVFDASGRLTAKVMLRPRSRVVGFGAGTVYVVRRDADDLQYLEQYRLR
jgi:hypothetical protein